MTDILFFSDNQYGHLIPTFPIARNLVNQGYKLAYIGQDKVIKMADDMGFETLGIFPTNSSDQKISYILSGQLDHIFHEIKPKLIIATAHTTLEILAVYFKYRIKTILVWSHFPIGLRFDSMRRSPYLERAKDFALERMKQIDPVELHGMIELFEKEGYKITELKDLVELCSDFSHFITCTKKLYFGRIAKRKNEIYLGYNNFIPRLNPTYDSNGIMDLINQKKSENKKVIFCSLGTVSGELFVNKARKFFEFIINCMLLPDLEDYFMVIAAGDLQPELSKLNLPNNVVIEKWLPQSELLSEVHLAVIHGGMGSLKECIFNNVPMIINPMGRDQFENTKMVTKRHLGVEMNFEQTSKSEFIEIIQQLENPIYQDGLLSMKKSFINDYNDKKEVAFVESLIGKPQSLNNKLNESSTKFLV